MSACSSPEYSAAYISSGRSLYSAIEPIRQSLIPAISWMNITPTDAPSPALPSLGNDMYITGPLLCCIPKGLGIRTAQNTVFRLCSALEVFNSCFGVYDSCCFWFRSCSMICLLQLRNICQRRVQKNLRIVTDGALTICWGRTCQAQGTKNAVPFARWCTKPML